MNAGPALAARAQGGARGLRLALLAGSALLAFAANSLLCRVALAHGLIDPAGFALLRLLSGAAMLTALRHGVVARRARAMTTARPLRARSAGRLAMAGPAPGAAGRFAAPGAAPRRLALATLVGPLALAAYAIGFSFAYVQLGAATGALILFGCVQAALLLAAMYRGEPAGGIRLAGALLALGGLAALLLPGATAPAPGAALLMGGAGIAWAAYTLAGRGSRDPLADTARNFALGCLPALACWLVAGPVTAAPLGVACALASGALASGLGYAAWYAALPALGTAAAGTAQLSVPVITALGGLALGEPLAPRTLVCGAVVLAGVALALRAPARG